MTKHSKLTDSTDSAARTTSAPAASEIRDEYPVIWVQRDFAPGYEQWWVMLDWPELVELVPNLQPRTNDNRQIIQRYCNGERGRLLAEEHAAKLRRLLRSDFPANPAQSSEARPGVEGAHEGTTADKSEPEKLNNAQTMEGK